MFADGLVMPRLAFPLQDGVLLVLETDNRDLYKYTDTNGDGVSDTKELVLRQLRPRDQRRVATRGYGVGAR